MAETSRLPVVSKTRLILGIAAVTLAGVGAGGCFGDPKDFHPRSGPGQGQGGYTPAGGQGGGGQGGSAGQGDGAATHCAAGTTPSFSVQWSLEDSAHRPTSCAAVGAATMDLDVLDVPTGVVSHDTFPCEALAGTGAALVPGEYSVAMRLRNAAGDPLSEAIADRTYAIAASCVTDLGLVPFEAVVITPDQFITLSWSIDRNVTGAPLSCADAGAANIELDVGTMTFRWPCGNGRAMTATLAPATYGVAVKLLDATGTVLSLTPTKQVTIVAGQGKALGGVVFDVN